VAVGADTSGDFGHRAVDNRRCLRRVGAESPRARSTRRLPIPATWARGATVRSNSVRVRREGCERRRPGGSRRPPRRSRPRGSGGVSPDSADAQ